MDEKENTRELVVVDVKRYRRVKQALEASEERFRRLFENVPIGIYRTTPDGRIVDSNPALVKMLGYESFAELAKRNLERDFSDAGYLRSDFIKRLQREGQIIGLESIWKKKDGSAIYVRENAKLTKGESGEVMFEGTVEDITQSKLAEEAQRVRTQQVEILNCVISKGNTVDSLEGLFEVVLDCVAGPLTFDMAAIFLFNQETRKGEMVAQRGLPKRFVFDEKYLSVDHLPFSRVLKHGQPYFIDDTPRHHPYYFKKWGWRMASSIPLVSKGRVIGAMNAASCKRDAFSPEEKSILEMVGKEAGTIISKLQTETELRESEKYYRTLIDTSPDIIAVMDLDARLQTVNQQFLQAGGYSYDDLIGRSTYDFVDGLERDLLKKRTSDFIKKMRISGSEYLFRKKDGCSIPLEVTAAVFSDGQGRPKGIIAIGRDIAERKRNEEAIRNSEESFRCTFEAIPDPAFIWTRQADGRFILTRFNRAAALITKGKMKSFLGIEPDRLFADYPEFLAKIRAGLKLGGSKNAEVFYKFQSTGESRWLLVDYAKTSDDSVLVITKDISERKRAELDIAEKNKVLAVLNEISLELASLPREADINEYISKKMMAITKAIYVGVNYYNKETRQLEFVSANTASRLLNELNRALGRKIGSITYDVSEAMYREITREVVGYRHSLHDVSFGAIPAGTSSVIQRLFNLEKFIGMALVVEGELIGTVIAAVAKGTPPVSLELLKSVSHIVSVSLRRRQAESQLVASEEKFKRLFYISPDSIILSRLDNSKIVSVNKGFTKILGYKESEVFGRTTLEMKIYKDPGDRQKIIDAVKTNGAIENVECWFVGKSGKNVLGLVSAALIEIEGEKYILGAIRDISEHKRAEEQLRFLSSVTENTSDAIIVTDADFAITYINKVAENFFGYSLKELKGRTPEIFNAEPHARKIQQEMYRIISSGKTHLGESLNKRKDGSTFYCEYKVMPLKDDAGRIYAYSSVQRDVSERKRSEVELRLREETFRSTFAAIPDPAYIWSRQANGRILLTNANQAADRITRNRIGNFLGIEVDKLFTDEPRLAMNIRRVMDSGESLNEEMLYHYQSTGESKWLVVDYVRTAADNVLVITKDISERKQSEAKLLAYQEQLQALTSEMILLEEKERRRIASELHDQIGQNLALCKLKVAAMEKSPAADAGMKGEMAAVRRLLECSIQDARSLIFDLSPPILYELGLQAALEWLAERIQEQYHVPVEFESRIGELELDNDRQVILFQVVRELLVNVGKHARASQAKVILSLEKPLLKIQVNDDGVGFDASRIFGPREPHGGFGFFSMRERLNYLGGSFEVKSRPGQGSQIILTVPQKDGGAAPEQEEP